jgi:hypothetical protein
MCYFTFSSGINENFSFLGGKIVSPSLKREMELMELM